MTINRTLACWLLAGTLLLPGCMTRTAHEADAAAEASSAAAATLIEGFMDRLLAQDLDGMLAHSSMPFWMDRWYTDAAALRAELPDDAPADAPKLDDVVVRIYPIGDLAALRPRIWKEIQSIGPAALDGLYVAAVALHVEDGNSESGLALLRRVNGEWKLAGLIEE